MIVRMVSLDEEEIETRHPIMQRVNPVQKAVSQRCVLTNVKSVGRAVMNTNGWKLFRTS